jgi:hypothetical protein
MVFPFTRANNFIKDVIMSVFNAKIELWLENLGDFRRFWIVDSHFYVVSSKNIGYFEVCDQ